MIETTIVMPIYMMLIYAIIYFGYATLGMQKQHQAAAYVAFLEDTPASETVNAKFFPWADDNWLGVSAGSDAQAHHEDVYYQNDKDAMLPEGEQGESGGFALHSLSRGDGSGYAFDQERIGVDLGIMALPKFTAKISLATIIDDVEPQIQPDWTDASRFLNRLAPEGNSILTRAGRYISTPIDFRDDNANWSAYQDVPELQSIARALTGVSHNFAFGSDHDYVDPDTRWLQRRHVSTSLSFDPLWAGRVIAREGEKPSEFKQYAGLNYDKPEGPLVTRSRVDVTRRGTGSRLTPSDSDDDAPSGVGLLRDVRGVLIKSSLTNPSAMQEELEAMLGDTVWRGE